MPSQVEHRDVVLHGHRVAYRTAGSGPLVVLLHGITGSAATWDDVMPELADHYTVLAPDLLGHGASAKPVGDYSLGAHAAAVRDLMITLGHERATVVGHSLGGGIALQFAYQFPERCGRLVLVSSGGLGPDLSMALRAATLPGAELVLPILSADPVLYTASKVGGFLTRIGMAPSTSIKEAWEGFASLNDREARKAFLATLRTIVDARGQRVSALDRLYLAQSLPTLVVWGGRDAIIPHRHATAVIESLPMAQIEVFEKAGHFPHRDEPQRFARTLQAFLDSTEPADVGDDDAIRDMLSEGG